MIYLVRCELKKIFKNKLNGVLLLILFGYNLIIPLLQLHNEWIHIPGGVIEQGVTLETFEGKPLTTSKAFYEYADQILSKYQGKPTQTTWETFVSDYNHYYEQFTREFDAEKMAEIYGPDWKSLWENNQTHSLTQKQRKKLLELSQNGMGAVYSYDEASDTFNIKPYNQYTARLLTLNLIYGQEPSTARLFEIENLSKMTDNVIHIEQNYPYYQLLHPELYIEELENNRISTKKSNLITWIKDHSSSLDFTYYSGISMTILDKVVSSSSLFTLLILSILCANTFAQEKSTKMNPLIVCTKTGPVRLALSKILANLSLCLGITLFMAGLYLSISCFYMIPTDWSGPASFLELYQSHPLYLTYAQYFLSWLQGWITGAVMIAGCISLFSCLSKSQIFSILAMLALVLAPAALQQYIPQWIWPVNPFVFYNARFMVMINSSVPDPMIASGIWLKDLIFLFWCMVLLTFSGIIIWKERAHNV